MATDRMDTDAAASAVAGRGGIRQHQSSKGLPGMQVKGEMSGGSGRLESADQAGERLSALLDGELSTHELNELLGELDSSPALGRQWSRMSAVQAAREGVHYNSVTLDFASGVMAALDEIPERIPGRDSGQAPASRVVDLDAARAARVPQRTLWRPAYGLAAAASIAAVAVLTAIGSHKDESSQALAVASVNVASPVQAGIMPVALTTGTTPQAGLAQAGLEQLVPDTGWSQLDPESARLFDDYVIEHSNYRVVPGMTGSLSYARFAAYGADARTANGSR